MEYCVYLTIYKGNKLPPFYIGSTSVKNISNGYYGTVSSSKYKEIWKLELRNHKNLFEVKIISKLSSRKEAVDREFYFQDKLNVVSNPLYVNQGIFRNHDYAQTKEMRISRIEKLKKRIYKLEWIENWKKATKGGKRNWPEESRTKITLSNRSRKCSEGTRKKMSLARIGKPLSDEARQKLREKAIAREKNKRLKKINV